MTTHVGSGWRRNWVAILTLMVLAAGGAAVATPAMAQRPVIAPVPDVGRVYIPELQATVMPYRFRNDHFVNGVHIRRGAVALRVVGTSGGGVPLERNNRVYRFRLQDDYILEVDGDRVQSADDLRAKLQQANGPADLGIYDHDQGTFGQYRTQP
jgi:hypothetical protein